MDSAVRDRLVSSPPEVRILVVGDVMVDQFVYGGVERISPEAPIPVMKVERTLETPGGASNVAQNLASLGARATLIGAIGADAAGERLRHRLAQTQGLDARLVVDAGRPTTVKTRYVAGRQQILRTDHEADQALPAEIEASTLRLYRAALDKSDVVVLSDYAKGVLSESLARRAVREARDAGKAVIVDTKSTSFAKFRGATLLTPNRHELQRACGRECRDDEQIVAAARSLLDEGICDGVVVTRGPEGMSFVDRHGTTTHIKTAVREVYDVSGAGDTAVAAMAVCIAAGYDTVSACEVANAAAGLVVAKPGTAVVTWLELGRALGRMETGGRPGGVFDRTSALRLVDQWRACGLRIAFTNGCFDLLHPGHLALLQQARDAADRLIVAVNTDRSVRRLKGVGRPVQNELARAHVLASLKCVDAVVLFEEETPLSLIHAVAPDVLAKGADYTPDKVVGAQSVVERGGRLLLIDLVPAHSTTRTIHRMTTVDAASGS